MTNDNNNNTTLDGLAQMVKRGFDDVGAQLAELSSKIIGVEERLGEEVRATRKQVSQRMDAVDGRVLDEVQPALNEHEERLSVVEKRVDQLDAA